MNRSNVKRIYEAIIFLGRQNIALRGHDETEDSGKIAEEACWNFLSLCLEVVLPLSNTCKVTCTTQVLHARTLIKLIGDSIQRRIVAQVKQCGVFGIICDETMDLSKVEQLSDNVRYVKDNLQVEEHFCGFWQLRRTDGETLFNHLKDVLSKLDLPLSQLLAQCYDGAANMIGRYSGLAAISCRKLPKRQCTSDHCHACLAGSLQWVSSDCS